MIATLSDLKTALQIPGTADDALLTRLMDAADSFIAAHTGRAFAGGTFTETHPAGGAFLFLRNYPVAAVTDVRVDPLRQFGAGTVRDPADYVVHADRGVVESATGPFLGGRGRPRWPESARVTYSTPTGAVPPAVGEAFTQLAGHWYRLAKTSGDLGGVLLTEKTDSSGTKTYPWALAGGLKVPAGVLQILAPFRVPAA